MKFYNLISLPCILTILVFGISSSVFGMQIPIDDDNTGKESIYIGQFMDPVSNNVKRYWANTVPMTWAAAKTWCVQQGHKPVSVDSLAERTYLVNAVPITSNYYWTSGQQQINYVWENNVPLAYEIDTWCTGPTAPTCIALHSRGSFHSLSCTTTAAPLCELKIAKNQTDHKI